MDDTVKLVSKSTFEAYVLLFNQRDAAGLLFTPDTEFLNLNDLIGLHVFYPEMRPDGNSLVEVAKVVRWRIDATGLWIRGRWQQDPLIPGLKAMIKGAFVQVGLTYSLDMNRTQIAQGGEVEKVHFYSFTFYPRS